MPICELRRGVWHTPELLMGAQQCTPTAFMKHILILLTLFLLSPPASLLAATCYDWPAVFAENRSVFKGNPGDKKILILPFVNKTEGGREQWLSEAFRLGLIYMMERGQKTDVIETRSAQTSFDKEDILSLARAAGAQFAIAGEYRVNPDTINIYFRFIDVGASKQIPIEEKTIEWRNTVKYAQVLIYMTRRASKAFKDVRVKKKELESIEHRVRNVPALQAWVLGQLAAGQGTAAQIRQSKLDYEQAIKSDFNYCYAYLGLAQSLAELGFMTKLEGKSYMKQFEASQKELTKVTLLCPYLVQEFGKRVTQYLEANALQTAAADRLAKGDALKARELASEAIRILPGDISSYRTLKKAGGHADGALLSSLASCR